MLVKVSTIRHAYVVNCMAIANTTFYAETINVFKQFSFLYLTITYPACNVPFSHNVVTAFAAVFALLHATFPTGCSVCILFFSTFF